MGWYEVCAVQGISSDLDCALFRQVWEYCSLVSPLGWRLSTPAAFCWYFLYFCGSSAPLVSLTCSHLYTPLLSPSSPPCFVFLLVCFSKMCHENNFHFICAGPLYISVFTSIYCTCVVCCSLLNVFVSGIGRVWEILSELCQELRQICSYLVWSGFILMSCSVNHCSAGSQGPSYCNNRK